MKRLLSLFVVLAVLLAPLSAIAQTTPPKINFQQGVLSWQYAQSATGGVATHFTMHCGTSTGSYSLHTVVPVTQLQMWVKDAIKTPGKFYCAVTADNEFGPSAYSNEVFFNAGAVPGSPTSLNVGPVLP